jgi:hypothetical protein
MHKFLLACALLLGAALLPTSARAAECVEFTAPNTISTPGTYCLSASYSGNTTIGAGIMIDADDVTFDCRGMTLHNTQTNPNANNYAIYLADQHNVRIRNCRITGGWTVGIYATQNNSLANATSNISLTDNDVDGAYWFGIHAYGTDIEIARNRITDIGGRGSFAMGIRVGASVLAGEPRVHVVRDNVVAGVTSPSNIGYGIYANNTEGSQFTGNSINRTRSVGGNYNYGISIASGKWNRLVDNHIVGVGEIWDVGIVGMSGDTCFHNYVRTDYQTINCDASAGNY